MFWNMATRKRLQRSNWIKMVTTDLVIGTVHAFATRKEADAARPGAIQVDEDVHDPLLNENVDNDMDVEGAMENDDEKEEEGIPPPEPEGLRRSHKIRAGVAPPERLTLVMKIRESEWDKQEGTSKMVKSESKQFFMRK